MMTLPSHANQVPNLRFSRNSKFATIDPNPMNSCSAGNTYAYKSGERIESAPDLGVAPTRVTSSIPPILSQKPTAITIDQVTPELAAQIVKLYILPMFDSDKRGLKKKSGKNPLQNSTKPKLP